MYFATYLTKREHELSTEEIFQLSDQCVCDNVISIVFTGGELFCRKEILKILDYLTDCGL